MKVSQPCTGVPTAIAPGCNDGTRPVTGLQERPSNVLTQKSVSATTTWVGPATVICGSTVRYSIPSGGRGALPVYAHGRSSPDTVSVTRVSPMIGEPLAPPVTWAPVDAMALVAAPGVSITTGSIPGKTAGGLSKPACGTSASGSL